MAEAFKKYKNRGNEDTIEGFMHLRKAHYMCGWDWGACLPDGGIFRPVTLLGIEQAQKRVELKLPDWTACISVRYIRMAKSCWFRK